MEDVTASFGSANQTKAQLAKLFNILLAEYDDILRRDPDFAQTLSQQSNAYEQASDESLTAQAIPGDGGLSRLVGLGGDAPTNLDEVPSPSLLPGLDETVSSQRLNAVADLFYVMEIERTGILKAILKLQEVFKQGELRLSDGPGAYSLYKFDQQQTLRYSSKERHKAYSRVFGEGRGTAESPRNAAFQRLFGQFVNSVAHFFRDTRISSLFSQQQATSQRELAFGSIAVVRRAGLNLRGNLKQASYGHVNIMRIEAMQVLRQAYAILDSDDVKRAYGAESGWDALGLIIRQHFGETTPAASRARLAVAGRQILNWLAEPYIMSSSRAGFETALFKIGDACEEVLTTQATLTGSEPIWTPDAAPMGRNIVPLKNRATRK